ncbi:cell division cycle-associated protein 7 isoform X2 [Arachis ipaensis]|uniref:cell division cycle-associated protein 7 isoform X2 n=1 Tax=Arachis ipaensis TaxID=130454 RepID=UPI000A2AF4F5|nr:cell division cycle-associated protein 7 isoform X2 [Arachis ipaensis]
MPALRKRNREPDSSRASTVTNSPASHDHQHQMLEYELSREQRIRENQERLGKLGILDLSLKLKSSNLPSKRTRSYTPKTPPTFPLPGPVRRSSRLQNVTPVSYSEEPVKKSEFRDRPKVVIQEGSKPEVYTEEHEKLLGNTDKSWTLFVDGVGKDGKRIYDSVQGKTCHQCRQKTLGYRTRCNTCNLVQGQFCGDCLYMRYGEHVLEALQNPNWKCPACRGICNCSLCRQAKGWAPTGSLYRKISALGYKSVAHYLIQTRRADKDVEKSADSNSISAKRTLPFSDVEVNESLEVKETRVESLKPVAETESHVAEVSAKRSLLFSDVQDQVEKVECSSTMKPPGSSSRPCSDSIAGRLRSRLKKP